MANTLNEELEGRFVVLLAETMAPAYRDIRSRIYKVEGGFGAASYTAGTGLFGYSPCDGEKWRADGYSVERFATDEEIAAVNTTVSSNELKEGSDDATRH
jgi:hypothetical protein